MERLTFEGNFCDLAQCRDSACRQSGTCTMKEVWERLKAYEDAGLSPQACAEAREVEETLSSYDYSISRMVELMKADIEGRVVVLPCKVGDTIYFARANPILHYKVTGYEMGEASISQVRSKHVDKETGLTFNFTFRPGSIGKTVFLTREEAEKALQQMQGKEKPDGTDDKPG